MKQYFELLLQSHCQVVKDRLNYDDKIKSSLKCEPATTKEESMEVGDGLIERYKTLREELSPLRAQIQEQYSLQQPMYDTYYSTAERAQTNQRLIRMLANQAAGSEDPDIVSFINIIKTTSSLDFPSMREQLSDVDKIDGLYPVKYPYELEQAQKDSTHLQKQFQVLISLQTPQNQQQLVEYFLDTLKNPSILDLKTRPEMDIDWYDTGSLPLDIMGLIFNFADLETCVQLRQVSSGWYAAYKLYDYTMSQKMRLRTLGMSPDPGTELQTWGDCALVFVGRLKSEKWKTAQDFGKWTCKNEVTKTHTIVALDTKSSLPHDYLGLSERGFIYQRWWKKPRLPKIFCPLSLTYYRDEEEDFYRPLIVFEDKTRMVVVFEDWGFVLPSYMRHFDGFHHTNEAFVFCCSRRKTAYIVPSEDTDFRNGKCFELAFDKSGGDRIIAKSPSSPLVINRRGDYSVVDVYNHRQVEMPLSTDTAEPSLHPRAMYHGLIWKSLDWRNRILVPMFVDSGTWYYREDKIIVTKAGNKWKQCGVDSERFLFRHGNCRLEIIDLLTQTITHVEEPEAGAAVMYPGFSGNQLGAWSHSKSTVAKFGLCLIDTKKDPDWTECDVSGAQEVDEETVEGLGWSKWSLQVTT